MYLEMDAREIPPHLAEFFEPILAPKPKSLLMIPERFAIAMQESGWYVRSRIAWCKKSAMPESVRDRPTSAWEHIWMFSKSRTYFFDQEAVREKLATPIHAPGNNVTSAMSDGPMDRGGKSQWDRDMSQPWGNPAGANLRNYWLLGPEPSTEQHYAAFPTEIPKRCILAGTSQRGQCPACGAPWVRVVGRSPGALTRGVIARASGTIPVGHPTERFPDQHHNGLDGWAGSRETLGWAPSCSCSPADPIPQTICDPFLGSGTTLLVASRLGRDGIGIELNEDYCRLAEDRIRRDVGPMFPDEVESATTPSPPRSLDLFALLDAEEAVS